MRTSAVPQLSSRSCPVVRALGADDASSPPGLTLVAERGRHFGRSRAKSRRSALLRGSGSSGPATVQIIRSVRGDDPCAMRIHQCIVGNLSRKRSGEDLADAGSCTRHARPPRGHIVRGDRSGVGESRAALSASMNTQPESSSERR